jgi:hypothetical protein
MHYVYYVHIILLPIISTYHGPNQCININIKNQFKNENTVNMYNRIFVYNQCNLKLYLIMVDSIPILINVIIKIKIFKIQFNLNHINNRALFHQSTGQLELF